MKRPFLYLTWLLFALAGSAWYYFDYRPLSQAHAQLKLDYVSLQNDNENLQRANEVLSSERDQALRSKHNIDKMALEASDALETCQARFDLAPWARNTLQLLETISPEKVDINGINLCIAEASKRKR